MFILSFFACSPSVDSFDANNDAFASTKDEPADPGTPPTIPDVLEIGYEPDASGFVEVRPYFEGEDGIVSGTPLLMGRIEDEAMVFNLPETATTADGSQVTVPVIYSIALRAPNDEDLPGVYTGLANAELIWLPDDGDKGGHAGWNVALRYQSEEPQWLELTSPYLTNNLIGLDLLTMEGGVAIDVESKMRLIFATGTEEQHVTIWDNPIGEDWSGTLPDVPPAETVVERNGMFGASFGGWAYVDEDEDGMRETEDWKGRLYADGAPVVVSWVAPARTLQNALAMRRNHARMGWVPYAQLEDHLTVLTEDMEIMVGPF